MIKSVAVKIGDTLIPGKQGERHADVILQCIKSNRDTTWAEKGFLTETGDFLNRHQAAVHAFICGQIQEQKESLISEDLW